MNMHVDIQVKPCPEEHADLSINCLHKFEEFFLTLRYIYLDSTDINKCLLDINFRPPHEVLLMDIDLYILLVEF